MRCHPTFSNFDAPRKPVLGGYQFEVLAPDVVEEDYGAVMESADRLTGFMGGTWPRGLTLGRNLVDLCWHAKEFDLNRSFAWLLRDKIGSYQGCAYVFPDFQGPGADVKIWVRSGQSPHAQEAALKPMISDWLNGEVWPDISYRVSTPSDPV